MYMFYLFYVHLICKSSSVLNIEKEPVWISLIKYNEFSQQWSFILISIVVSKQTVEDCLHWSNLYSARQITGKFEAINTTMRKTGMYISTWAKKSGRLMGEQIILQYLFITWILYFENQKSCVDIDESINSINSVAKKKCTNLILLYLLLLHFFRFIINQETNNTKFTSANQRLKILLFFFYFMTSMLV